MEIVDKMVAHIENLLGQDKFTFLIPEKDNKRFYMEITKTTLKDYFLSANSFWRDTDNIFIFPKYHSEKIVSSFIQNKDNYNLLLHSFEDLKLSITKYDYQFILCYIKDQEQKIDFLKNFKCKTQIIPFYLKEDNFNKLLNKICIGSIEENIDILINFFENTKPSLTKLNTKILIKTFLTNKFNDEKIVNQLQKYWISESKRDTLVVKYDNYQIKASFLDKKTLVNNYTLINGASKKDYERMLQEIANIFKTHFKYKNIKVNIFDTNTYVITALINKNDKEVCIDKLWEPMINQYILLNQSNQKNYLDQLSNFLPSYLLKVKLINELDTQEIKHQTNKI